MNEVSTPNLHVYAAVKAVKEFFGRATWIRGSDNNGAGGHCLRGMVYQACPQETYNLVTHELIRSINTDPLTRARVRKAWGHSFHNFGECDIPLWNDSLEICQGPEDVKRIIDQTLTRLAPKENRIEALKPSEKFEVPGTIRKQAPEPVPTTSLTVGHILATPQDEPAKETVTA